MSDCREKIIEKVQEIDNTALLVFIYNFIVSMQKKMGVQDATRTD